MKIKYFTLQNWEPHLEPVSNEPELTRVSDYESIESMFARFQVNKAFVEIFKPIAQLSPEEQDELYNGTDLDDLADEDLTVQKQFLDSVQSSLKAEKEEEKKSEPTQAQPEPEPTPDKVTETE